MEGKFGDDYFLQPLIGGPGRTHSENPNMGVFRQRQGRRKGAASLPMNLERPEEQRVLGRELGPEALPITVPEALPNYPLRRVFQNRRQNIIPNG